MKIGITSDHGGYDLKNKIIKYYRNKIEIIDFGTNIKESVDYPDYAFKLGEAINNKEIDFGISICKTGIGMCIALNKIKGIYCAKLDNANDAIYAKIHNNANAISFGGAISFRKAKKLIDIFIKQSSNIEERHINRINKIRKYENEH